MKTLILIILLTLSANADFWSRMIKGEKRNVGQQSVSMTEIDINGIQAGYIDYYEGMDNYVPIRNPFYDGYAVGAMRAKKEIEESRNRYNDGISEYYNRHKYYYNRNDNYQERSNFNYPLKVKHVNDNENIFYDH